MIFRLFFIITNFNNFKNLQNFHLKLEKIHKFCLKIVLFHWFLEDIEPFSSVGGSAQEPPTNCGRFRGYIKNFILYRASAGEDSPKLKKFKIFTFT